MAAMRMPVAETSRMLLRPFTIDDAEDFHALNTLELVRYSMEEPTQTVEEAKERLASRALKDYATRGYGRHACVDKSTGRVIGFAGFKHVEEFGHDDIGIRTLVEYQGKGLATEASKALLPWAFSAVDDGGLGLEKVVGAVVEGNHASCRVLTKLGFTHAQTVDYQGTQILVYELTKQEFEAVSPTP